MCQHLRIAYRFPPHTREWTAGGGLLEPEQMDLPTHAGMQLGGVPIRRGGLSSRLTRRCPTKTRQHVRLGRWG